MIPNNVISSKMIDSTSGIHSGVIFKLKTKLYYPVKNTHVKIYVRFLIHCNYYSLHNN